MNSRLVLRVASGALLATVVTCGNDNDIIATGPSTTYVAVMNAANQRPLPDTSRATGIATYTQTGNGLNFSVVVNNLTGPATATHIHLGSAGFVGPIIVAFITSPISNGLITSGTIDLSRPISVNASTITGDSLIVLLNNGNAYTDVHTSLFPAGEIRGQIVRR